MNPGPSVPPTIARVQSVDFRVSLALSFERSVTDGPGILPIDRVNRPIHFPERNDSAHRGRFVFILQNIHYSLAAVRQRVDIPLD